MELTEGATKLTSILNRLFAVSGHGVASYRALSSDGLLSLFNSIVSIHHRPRTGRRHVAERHAYAPLAIELRCANEVQFIECAYSAIATGQQIIQAVAIEPIIRDRVDCFAAQREQRQRFRGNARLWHRSLLNRGLLRGL